MESAIETLAALWHDGTFIKCQSAIMPSCHSYLVTFVFAVSNLIYDPITGEV